MTPSLGTRAPEPAGGGPEFIRPTSDPRAWLAMREAAEHMASSDAVLRDLVSAQVLQHPSFEAALAHIVASRLADPCLPHPALCALVEPVLKLDPAIVQAVHADIAAACDRDPACNGPAEALLFYKGLQALVVHRIAHWMWQHERRSLARWLQSRCSERLGVDIHPAARIGRGILLDHAHGIVIGETAVLEDDVSLLHNVTLGGTGKHSGDRHPKVRSGVLIGAGALILGNIEIGRGAKVGAGSVVMAPVLAHTTAAGTLARRVGVPSTDRPALEMNHRIGHSAGGHETSEAVLPTLKVVARSRRGRGRGP